MALTSDVAQISMDATGETGSNTRMGLGPRRQDTRKARKIDRTIDKTKPKSEEEVTKDLKTKKEGVMSSFQEGREDRAASIERQRELQAVPKADEFERINLAEVFEI